MALFSYKAKDPNGQIISGTLEAENPSVVTTRLQAMGYFPVAIQNESQKKNQSLKAAKAFTHRVKTADTATFNRQLADLLSSGIPLVKALDVIQNQTANETLQQIIQQINQDVSGGDSLAVAMSKHPTVFSKLYCAMVKAGEAGGLLDQVLQRLADFSEADAETRSKIKSAMAYPVVMVFAGIGAVIVLMTVVMPKILKIYSEMQQTLPLPTQILLSINDILRQWWWLILGSVVAVVVVLWKAGRTPEGRRLIDTMLLKVPLIGGIILKREVANFSRTLGSLLHNGVSILPALDIVHGVLGNQLVADEVAMIPQNVTQGEGIAGPLKGSAIFPPVVVNMIAIGEETGRLDDVLMKIAKSYETEVERSVKTLTSLLEPIIILVMGLVVAFIVISMLLPIFSIDPTQG